MDFCSPSIKLKNKKYCYNKPSLIVIINSWNALNNNNKIDFNNTDTTAILMKKLNIKFQQLLHKKVDTYWAWIDIIKLQATKQSNYKIIDNLKKIENMTLRPSQPIDWVKNPQEWLSNFDIQKVLNQYQEISALKYKFLGVFSIDFGLKNKSDNKTCLFSKHCNINIASILASKKVSYIGFITNLSRSSEPGTHWTSSFFVLDPSLPSYGGYYYDSTARKIPQDLQPVFIDIKNQAEKLFLKKPFPVYVNNNRHQHGNNACGLFSIAFQVRWVLLLKNNKKTIISDVINHPSFTDTKMDVLRLKYFRPNILSIKKIKESI